MELLHSKKTKTNNSSSQKYVDVREIKGDVMVLKNNSLRAVLLVSSINFDLKSIEEQDAIIIGYQGFLNSLDFPLQIMTQSRKLDIDKYLELLKKKEKVSENELMKMQISEYSNFIKNLTDVSQIMSHYFYLVIPFYPTESKEGGFMSKVSGMINPKQLVVENTEMFETYKNQLWQRIDQVASGLSRIGLNATPLKTEDLIELLYSSYNPSLRHKDVIKDLESMDLQ
ncbi:hypothetical protein ACFL08_04635 [Patescibacteria group bacterium]